MRTKLNIALILLVLMTFAFVWTIRKCRTPHPLTLEIKPTPPGTTVNGLSVDRYRKVDTAWATGDTMNLRMGDSIYRIPIDSMRGGGAGTVTQVEVFPVDPISVRVDSLVRELRKVQEQLKQFDHPLKTN